MSSTIGIDPGVTGAIAWLAEDGNYVEVVDMPIIEASVGTGRKYSMINGSALTHILKRHVVRQAFVERVHAMPKNKNGVIAAFSMGQSFGTILTALGAAGIGCELVTPRQWKKEIGVKTKDKEVARAQAIRHYPAAPLGRKKDHSRAEALLIARWGYLRRIGVLK